MKNEIDDKGQRRTREEIADILQLAHARHGIADAPRLEIGDRQCQQVAEKPRAQLDVDPIGGVGEHIGAQHAAASFRKSTTATRPITSTSSVVRPRCTSTLSMTTWKNSGETRAKTCRKNDATSTSPRRRRYLWIAPRNQRDVEAAGEVHQSGAARHQHQAAVPNRLEFGSAHQRRPRRLRRSARAPSRR